MVVDCIKSKHALSVPRQGAGGTDRPLQDRVVIARVAFVAAVHGERSR